jgi:hypothetical protein
VDCGAKIIPGAHAAGQPVRHWLIHKVPWVEAVLEGLRRHDLLLGREEFGTKIARLGQERALLGNGGVGPTEKLDNCTLLSFAVVTGLGC